jgi:hypothetical protein
LLSDAAVSALELEHRKQWHHLPAVRLVDRDFPRAASLGNLVTKAALPCPRFGHNTDDLCVPGNRLLESNLQSRHLALAPDELGETTRAGPVETSPYSTHTFELEDVQWVAQSLDASERTG